MDRSKIEAQIATQVANLIDAAHARGVEETLAKIKAAIAAIEASDIAAAEGAVTDNTGAQVDKSPSSPVHNPEPRQGSEQLRVLTAIRLNPGSRGIDIVNFLGGQVHERTVRTSIHRLRKRGAIIRDGDKWFPATPGAENRGGQTPEASGNPSGGMAERLNAADSKSVGGL